MNEAILIGIIAAVGPIGAIAGLGWWLRDRFAESRDFTRTLMETHEAKDVERFQAVREEIHDLRVEQARHLEPVHHRR